MTRVAVAEVQGFPVRAVRRATEAEELASRSAATLLITAATRAEVKALARWIHEVGAPAAAPLVQTRARAFPSEPGKLRERCADLFDAARGGSLLITDIESMRARVQEQVIELFAELQDARAGSAGVRIISGTTVWLFDRVAAGTFSAQLFYRLNLVHLVQTGPPAGRPV